MKFVFLSILSGIEFVANSIFASKFCQHLPVACLLIGTPLDTRL